MTTVAFVGNFDSTTIRSDEVRLADALERQQVDVIRVDYPWPTVEDLALSRDVDWLLFGKCKELAGGRFERLARSARPQIAQVLFDLMDYEERRFRGIPVLLSNRLKWWIPMAQRMDVVFSKELGNFDRYASRGINCVYLDQAVDPRETPIESPMTVKSSDIAFFGKWTPSRERILSLIARDARVVTYSARPRDWRRTPFRSLGPVHGTDLARAVNSARLVWGESATHDVAGYWSDRRYRVMGRGGSFVTRYTEGVEESFTNDVNIAWYRSLDEAETLVESLLRDESHTRSIGVEAAKHVHDNHTYDHRTRQMLTIFRA